MQRPKRKHWTWDDYVQLPENGKRYEVIEGGLVMMAGPSIDHQYAALETWRLLREWVEAGAGGLALAAPLDVELAYDIVLQPDVIWIARNRVAEITAHHVRGIPDLVVEVLSPSSQKLDRIRKAAIYARYAATEFWLVDPVARTVEIHRLEHRRFVLHAAGTGDTELVSRLDAALKVVPARLFRDAK